MSSGSSEGKPPLQHLVVMGVAGSGKSTVGEYLARRLGCAFLEGDAYHPPENIRKMSSGIALDDTDREPWLIRLGELMRASSEPVVVTCSALKRKYRDLLREASGADIVFVYLHGARELLTERMGSRTGHFMPPSLLESQLASLEVPQADENSVRLDIGPAPEEIVDRAVQLLRNRD